MLRIIPLGLLQTFVGANMDMDSKNCLDYINEAINNGAIVIITDNNVKTL